MITSRPSRSGPTKEQRSPLTGPSGSDGVDWQARLDMDAAEVLAVAESERARQFDPDWVILVRWVRDNKVEPMGISKAKPCLAVQGSKDRSFGRYH